MVMEARVSACHPCGLRRPHCRCRPWTGIRACQKVRENIEAAPLLCKPLANTPLEDKDGDDST